MWLLFIVKSLLFFGHILRLFDHFLKNISFISLHINPYSWCFASCQTLTDVWLFAYFLTIFRSLPLFPDSWWFPELSDNLFAASSALHASLSSLWTCPNISFCTIMPQSSTIIKIIASLSSLWNHPNISFSTIDPAWVNLNNLKGWLDPPVSDEKCV